MKPVIWGIISLTRSQERIPSPLRSHAPESTGRSELAAIARIWVCTEYWLLLFMKANFLFSRSGRIAFCKPAIQLNCGLATSNGVTSFDEF